MEATPTLYVLCGFIVFVLGMLWYCFTSALKEADLARRWLAYETRDDATIKTYDDVAEIKKTNTNSEISKLTMGCKKRVVKFRLSLLIARFRPFKFSIS